MILHINEDITPAVMDKLAEALNKLEQQEPLLIYFSSNGGDTYSAEAIIDIINAYADRIVLTAYGDLHSAGFNIFFRCNCQRQLLPKVNSIVHLTRITTTFIGNKDNWEKLDSKNTIEFAEKAKETFLQFIKGLGFTKKEISTVAKGEDLYLDYERLTQLLQKQQD
jgi:ATP-dependent protease ClpP protease subunit